MPFSSEVIETEPYTPNGSTFLFPFFFLALSEDEIQVVLTDADGNETLVTEGFDVLGIDDPDGGFISFAVAPNYTGQTLTIRAAPNWGQETDFENQGAYNPHEVNKALDRLAQKLLVLRNGGVTGGEGTIGTVTWGSVQGKPTTFPPAAHVHAAADVTSGVFDAARIPGLDGSKITTGTVAAARISGLDASKITSGTIDQARLPVTSGGVVSSGAIADLTAPQQALIVEGTLVTTSDGAQWRYSGTGSKTLEASYVELSTATDWAALTSVPPEITSFAALSGVADRLPYFSGTDTLSLATFTAEGRTIAALASQAALQARASVLTTKGDLDTYSNQPARLGVGTDGQTLFADSSQTTGLRWGNPVGGSSTVGGPASFVAVFSGNGDGSTNNDAAFTAAEASSYDRIWLPEGSYFTTKVNSQLKKWYEGPGKIKIVSGAGTLAGGKKQTVDTGVIAFGPSAAVGDVNGTEYGEDGDVKYTDIHYQYVRNARQHIDQPIDLTLNGPYFQAGAYPHFRRTFILAGGGHSGTNTHIQANVPIGATTVDVLFSSGISIGDKIGFQVNDNHPPGMALNGTPLAGGPDIVTVTNVAPGGGVGGSDRITFTPATANAYTYPGADNRVPAFLSGYSAAAQISKGRRTFNADTFITIDSAAGGDVYGFMVRASSSYQLLAGQTHWFDGNTVGQYGGSTEMVYDGQYGQVYEGRIDDHGHNCSGIGWVTTYNRTNDTFSVGDPQRWVTWIHDLPKNEGSKPLESFYYPNGLARVGIDLTALDVSTDGQRAIQMKLNHRLYFDASATPAGPAQANVRARGFWGDIQGDTYITAINDGSDRLDFYAGGVRTLGLRSTSVNIPSGIQVNSAGPISVTNQIAVAEGQTIRLNGLNGNTYFQVVAGAVQLVVNGTVRGTWGP